MYRTVLLSMVLATDHQTSSSLEPGKVAIDSIVPSVICRAQAVTSSSRRYVIVTATPSARGAHRMG